MKLTGFIVLSKRGVLFEVDERDDKYSPSWIGTRPTNETKVNRGRGVLNIIYQI